MKNLVVVSLVLILTIVLGVIIRGTIFTHYLPEGFESSQPEEGENKKEGEEEKKETEKKEGQEEKKDGEKKEGEGEGEAVQLDTQSGIKDFMASNSSNGAMMNNITSDTKAMIQNQKELMEMMKTVQPALSQGMEFMKAFKGMMA
jgi:hypothetical protein